MSTRPVSPPTLTIYLIGVLGTFFIVAALIWIMYAFTQPPPVDEGRAAERRKNLSDMNAQSKEQLETYAWIDRSKGIVRLPIARAMELVVREWQNPAQGQSNLVARLPKATAVAPPPPNRYE
jgi:hypothetical protein